MKTKQLKEFILDLKEYHNKKIKLAKSNKFLTEEEKQIHINCCIDTKMFIDEKAEQYFKKEIKGDKIK